MRGYHHLVVGCHLYIVLRDAPATSLSVPKTTQSPKRNTGALFRKEYDAKDEGRRLSAAGELRAFRHRGHPVDAELILNDGILNRMKIKIELFRGKS